MEQEYYNATTLSNKHKKHDGKPNNNSIIDNFIKNGFNGLRSSLIGEAVKCLKTQCVFTITIKYWDVIHEWVQYVLPKYKNVTKQVGIVKSNNNDSEFCVNKFAPLCMLDTPDDAYSVFINYKNHPIIVSVKLIPGDENVNDGTIMEFKCINNREHIISMKEFIYRSTKYASKCETKSKDMNTIDSYDVNEYSNINRRAIQKRSFDNVYVEDDLIKSIDKHISSFINNKDFYIKHGIPYHTGIILSGEPSTGKSSLANVIGSKYCGKIVISTLSSLVLNRTNIVDIAFAQTLPTLIVVEDVDCQALSNARDETKLNSDNKITMSDVLNVLDGSNCYDNCILLFTTNHIENIEPALIRPGRMDCHFHIGYPSIESLNKFFMAYYGKKHNLNSIKSKLSIADLQVKVMTGYTYEQLVDYCKE